MHEIDLIPADYRHERALYRIVQRCSVLIGVLVAAAAIAAGSLRHATTAARAEIAELDKAVAMAEQQQAAIDTLNLQKQIIESQATLRSGLRAHAPVDELIASIGVAAVDAGVWFQSWRIERLGVVVPVAPVGAEGFFVVEPSTESGGVRSQILIAGRAPDIGGVSTLVQTLSADPRIDRVQLQRVSRDAIEQVVAFELELTTDYAGEML
jgi:Tfp pilus assembly protein PilN